MTTKTSAADRNAKRTNRKRLYIAPKDVLESHNCSVVMDNENDAEGEACGIGIKSHGRDFVITSHAGDTIANGGELEEWTDSFVEKAKRKLCLPEIVFSKSHVTLSEGTNPIFQYTARDALKEWASCHEHLKDKDEVKGVSIMKTADAALWATKNRTTTSDSDDNQKPQDQAELNYDWTFSTPYVGTTTTSTSKETMETDDMTTQQHMWDKQSQSGLSWSTLRDKNQPILFFDEVCLYEDDLHDNGCTSCTVKLRVMPSCLFILYQLRVRVDRVIMRTREIRHFIKFDNKATEQLPVSIYRDVTWRESPWDQLSNRNIQSWRWEDSASFYDEDAIEKEQQLQRLLQQLPTVKPPEDIAPHACLHLTV